MRSFFLGLATVLVVLAIAIQPTSASSKDETIAKGIADQLKESGLLKDYRVGVKYREGVVWLSGSVTSPRQKEIAELIVHNCGGVEHVVSKLEVDQPEGVQTASTGANQRTVTQAGNNMPVPYARAGRGVQPANYCPGGNCMPGGAMGPPAYGAGGGGGYAPAAMGQAVSYDNPQMPGYAWPSYAASPNYAALTYPQQYSASAWPYIGPFYPYPQVPLGWRKVTLEWDDGWWFLDFKDCKHCK